MKNYHKVLLVYEDAIKLLRRTILMEKLGFLPENIETADSVKVAIQKMDREAFFLVVTGYMDSGCVDVVRESLRMKVPNVVVYDICEPDTIEILAKCASLVRECIVFDHETNDSNLSVKIIRMVNKDGGGM